MWVWRVNQDLRVLREEQDSRVLPVIWVFQEEQDQQEQWVAQGQPVPQDQWVLQDQTVVLDQLVLLEFQVTQEVPEQLETLGRLEIEAIQVSPDLLGHKEHKAIQVLQDHWDQQDPQDKPVDQVQ